MIKITLLGEPISKKRARTLKRGWTFDPQEKIKHNTKFQILDQVSRNYSMPFPANVAIEIEFNFYFTIRKEDTNLFNWGLLDHLEKFDVDNLAKFYLDCMNTLIYEDDKQVNLLVSRKEYSETPRTEILIVPKKPQCSDQVQEVLSLLPTKDFVDIATQLNNIVELDMAHTNPYHLTKSVNTDYEEIAYCILEFAEKHADNLKKINKKFPGLAKILKEKMENK